MDRRAEAERILEWIRAFDTRFAEGMDSLEVWQHNVDAAWDEADRIGVLREVIRSRMEQ